MRIKAAGCLCIRVPNDELRPLQIFFVVDLGAHQVLDAHRIDEQPYALILNLAVAFLDRLVEGESVLESGTAAAGNEYAKHQVRIVLFPD